MSHINNITARTILDSGASWTIEVALTTDDGVIAKASVPAGKSKGAHEAVSLDAETAKLNVIEKIAPAVKGFDVVNLEALDNRMLELDATPDKSALGANAILGVSLASARAGAKSRKMPLWQHIKELANLPPAPKTSLRLFSLFTEGGLHADGGLPFQEYLVIPKSTNIAESTKTVAALYGAYKEEIIKQFGGTASHIGDEGAFAPAFNEGHEPYAVMLKVASMLGLDKAIDFGMDAAATNISLSPTELTAFYKELKTKYNILYLEDTFGEEDFKNFAALRSELGDDVMITGDDLTVTNLSRMKLAHDEQSINSIIIKPNQIGTLTETLNAIRLARDFGWRVVISHRGRETNDDFIADLAWGVGADGIKLGSPARGERVAKYNRLMEIEEETN